MAETPEEVAKALFALHGLVGHNPERFISALRAQYVAGLEAALAVVDEEDEGPSGYDWQLGDVSDFRKRCTKAIRELAEQAKAGK